MYGELYSPVLRLECRLILLSIGLSGSSSSHKEGLLESSGVSRTVIVLYG